MNKKILSVLGFQYASSWNRRTLSIVGAWPTPDDDNLKKAKPLFCALWIFLVVYLPQTAGIIVLRENMDAVIASCAVNWTVLISIIKFISFHYHRESIDLIKINLLEYYCPRVLNYLYLQEILMIIDMMAMDWKISRNEDQNKAIIKIAGISRAISKASAFVSCSIIISFATFQVPIRL